jgi:isopentenyl diphosphate isomerase/L-lactate dehydrogenase-like FMN-dependent dehydrogenase
LLLVAPGLLRAATGDRSLDQDRISTAAEALNVFDLQAVARRNLSPAHYTYLSMGVEDEVTLRANRTAFADLQLRPRRLVDVRDVDTSLDLLESGLSCPILLAPIGSQRAYHAEGELAVARAARRRDCLPILSMGSSVPMQEVATAYGRPPWAQIYGNRSGWVTRHFLRQAEATGCPVVVLTVDIVGLPTMRERIERYRRDDDPGCRSCHDSMGGRLLRGATGAAEAIGLDLMRLAAESMVLDWDVVDRIRDATSMKLVIKGILTHEDAHACIEHGVDGVIVSNHGGRAEDNGLTTIEALPEIVRAIDGRIPVLVDSGFRRGTDVFKALALGASAVCVGRPYVWGLAAFGQEGVEAVLSLLRRELETIMRQMGTRDLRSITRDHLRARRSTDRDADPDGKTPGPLRDH